MGFWDDNAALAKSITESKFIKFVQEGDEAEGVITAVGTKTWPAKDGESEKTDLVFDIRTPDGRDRVITASTADLKKKLAEQRADVGDFITVIFVTEVGKRKIFKVTVKKGVPLPAAATQPSLVPAGQKQDAPF